jgi:monovalent cation:H+ antiporter-2, CPA2 family
MIHEYPLVAAIVVGLGLAFAFGTAANRLKLSPLVGYLLAGVAVGPFTPGFIADSHLTMQLAEIGVILLMFGVGMHFSLKDLLSVRAIAVPGALIQVTLACGIGVMAAHFLGWPLSSSIVFALALSIASTVVVMRALTERRLIDTERGRIAVGWLVMQDLITVIALVLIPPFMTLLNGGASGGIGRFVMSLWAVGGKLAAFGALMFFAGRRIVPWLLHYVAHTGSRELFRLAVLSVALGVAFVAAELFGVSIALGAFLAGMILSESTLAQRAAEETLPLRDAFAVLFFVSVGMVFDPLVIVHDPVALIATIAVVLASAGISFGLVRLFGQPWQTALLIGAGFAQIGEFSFVLADFGVGLKILPERGRDLILGASILTIFANPFLFSLAEKLCKRFAPPVLPETAPPEIERELVPTRLTGHVAIVGYGRVGSLVAGGLKAAGIPVLVIENAPDALEHLRTAGIEFIDGSGTDAAVLKAANLSQARHLFVAIPDAFEAAEIVKQARAVNPRLHIVARAHFDDQIADLTAHGANAVVMGERELARAMLLYAGVPR